MRHSLSRRLMLASLAAPALQGCAAPLPPLRTPATTPEAASLVGESAAAHGLGALATISDLNMRYAGHFHTLVGKLQPALVDAGFRGRSEERLLLRDRVVAQAHTGPSGHKQVVRRIVPGSEGEVRVWFNGEEAHDTERRAAAALVVDDYSLFLLGPMLLAQHWADRSLVMELGDGARIVVAGHEHDCDVLRVRMTPGLGLSEGDELAMYIDRDAHLMRRVRFTVNGMDSTRGAIAEVDAFDHVTRHDVSWPTGFQERLLRPLPLAVHDWRLEGLDVNRGLHMAEVSGPEFAGNAISPAAELHTA